MWADHHTKLLRSLFTNKLLNECLNQEKNTMKYKIADKFKDRKYFMYYKKENDELLDTYKYLHMSSFLEDCVEDGEIENIIYPFTKNEIIEKVEEDYSKKLTLDFLSLGWIEEVKEEVKFDPRKPVKFKGDYMNRSSTELKFVGEICNENESDNYTFSFKRCGRYELFSVKENGKYMNCEISLLDLINC